jgi:hypothetical protein
MMHEMYIFEAFLICATFLWSGKLFFWNGEILVFSSFFSCQISDLQKHLPDFILSNR